MYAMSEADECAASLTTATIARIHNWNEARDVATEMMPGETHGVIDAFADSLLAGVRHANQIAQSLGFESHEARSIFGAGQIVAKHYDRRVDRAHAQGRDPDFFRQWANKTRLGHRNPLVLRVHGILSRQVAA